MFQAWRLKLREAQEAFQVGDLTEACRLLRSGNLMQFLPGRKLAAQVADRRTARAKALAGRGDLDSAWKELEAAGQLAGETSELQRASQALLDQSLQQIHQLIVHGDPARALTQIEALQKRKVDSGRLATLKQVAQRVQSAAHLAKRGKFAEAESQVAVALQLQPNCPELEAMLQNYQRRSERIRQMTEQLHRAMSEQCWSEVVTLADQVLELSPESALARDARKQAWAKVGAKLTESRRLAVTQAYFPASQARGDASGEEPGQRFLLWVDGVGGYLVCLADEITLGQAALGNHVDVGILADVSRRHAKIRREGEGYVIESMHTVRINNRAVRTPAVLRDGDEVELGSGVRLRFRRPHALSASARLDLISRHRTQPYADSIVLMAESLVLGPRWQNHVVCPEWTGDVVLYRQDDGLYCRAMEALEIDGELCDGRGRLNTSSHIAGSDFSMSLEELDRCITQPLL